MVPYKNISRLKIWLLSISCQTWKVHRVVQTVVSLKDCVDVQVYGNLNKGETSAIDKFEGSLRLSLYLGLACLRRCRLCTVPF